MNEEYILVERSPTVDEYQRLRKSAGWYMLEDEVIKIYLGSSG